MQMIVSVNDADAAAGIANNYYVSAPLICNIRAGCEKLIPSCLMPQIRTQIAVDSLINFSITAAIHI